MERLLDALFDPARPVPPLEPGVLVYKNWIVPEIEGLKEDKFVKAGEFV